MDLLMHGIVFVASLLLDGLAMMLLWRWFVASTFGFPAITFTTAMGLSIMASLLTHHYIPTSRKQKEEALAVSILVPLLAIVIGWSVKQWQ